MHALIHQLASRFALDAARRERLWALSGLHQRPPTLLPHLHRGLAVLAALLLGAGLIFWVAANWPEQTRAFKLHLLEAAVLASAGAALLWPRGRTALLLLATLALGGLLAFVGQTYQTGADAWQLFATWAALALVWALAVRRDAMWTLWLLIAGLALGLWSGDALFDPLSALLGWHRGRGWLTPLLWALIFLLPLALPRLRLLAPGATAAPLSWRLATLMALSAWCIHALLALFTYQPTWQYFFNGGLVLAAAALAWAWRPRDFVVLAAAVLTLNVLVVAGFANLLWDTGGNAMAMALLMTLIAAICVGVSATWLVRLQREEGRA